MSDTHGTNNRYNRGCRCDACTTAHAAYGRQWRRGRRRLLAKGAEVTHGRRATYSDWGCRCGACRAANAEDYNRQTEQRTQLLAEGADVAHGTRSTYGNWGCRCDACTQANTGANTEYRQRSGYNERRRKRAAP